MGDHSNANAILSFVIRYQPESQKHPVGRLMLFSSEAYIVQTGRWSLGSCREVVIFDNEYRRNGEQYKE